jgi:hypothetical protein
MTSPNSPTISPRFLPVVIMPQPPMEWNRTAMAPSGSSEGEILADDGVRMVNAQREIGLAIGGAAPVLAPGLAQGVFARAERVLGTEIARADAIAGAEERGVSSGVSTGNPACAGWRAASLALPKATRMSRASGLSPAMPSSVRSRMMTCFLPRNALMTAASGNGR